jgi:hypothetical protein
LKPVNYDGWSRYNSPQLSWHFENVKASGCYELARNWCLLKGLAVERPARLVNLGPAKLFLGNEGDRLDRFAAALGADQRSHFMKVAWPDFLGKVERHVRLVCSVLPRSRLDCIDGT